MDVTSTVKWTERSVLAALREMYLPQSAALNTEEWAFLTQVPLRCGNQSVPDGQSPTYWTTNERTIDAFVVRNWSGGKHGHERLALEVKVSKADYQSETETKRAPAEASAHRCAYAAPAGLIDPSTLPDGWGLLEVSAVQEEWMSEPRIETKWKKHAKRRVPTANLDYLVSAGFRRASRAEERIRRGDSDAAEVARLRVENINLAAVAARAVEARDREIVRAKNARSELLAFSGAQECSSCGLALTWKRGGHLDSQWRHKDPSVEYECLNARQVEYHAASRRGEPVDYPSHPVPVPAVTNIP